MADISPKHRRDNQNSLTMPIKHFFPFNKYHVHILLKYHVIFQTSLIL